MDHYSYTQLSTYLQCPLKYKFHYLEGWQEMEDKASLIFGRVFQSAVEAQFLRTCRSSTPTATAGRRCWSKASSCWSNSEMTSRS